jgi:hypothetical protein
VRHKGSPQDSSCFQLINWLSSERRFKKGAIVIVFGRLCSLIQNVLGMVQGITPLQVHIASIEIAPVN